MPVTVNVAIIGDEGSGKTSLVLSAAQRTFRPGDSVPVLPPTAFRVKLQNEECSCVCHDSASEKMEDIKAVVRQCDVVLICFNMAAQTSLHSAIHVWLPKMTEINKEIPIIMVGCKEDQAVITQTQIACMPLPGDTADVQQLDTTINGAVNLIRYDKCSARHPDTTLQVFQHACDACVNPVLALYNHVRERLRCKAVRAFNRILDIADEDQDGALNDEELNHFHEFCFGRSLPLDELNGLKQALMARSTDSVTTLGVTRNGFMQLQAMMIQQQRLDICWTVLRSFGYNRQLQLKPELFAHIKDLSTEPNTVCMLSREAVMFLKAQFQQRCSAIDALLPLDLLLEDTGPQSLFHNAPPVSQHAEHPLGKQNIRPLLVHSIHTRKLPLESFLCIWAYCALVDARKAVIAMLYLGYRDTYRRSRQPLGTTAADRLLVRAPRRRSSNSLTIPRPVTCGIRVFNCLLFGTKGCGKTKLLHMLAGTQPNPHAAPYTPKSETRAARLIPGHGDFPDTILVLIEVPVASAEDLSMKAAKDPAVQERLLSNDAMLFGFDSASLDSYEKARTLSVALSDATNNVIPVALLGLKADLGVSSSITSMAAKDCAELHVDLLPGLLLDSNEPDHDGAACRWASLVVDVCCNPAAHIASTPALAAKRSRSEYVWRCAKYAAATGAGLTGMVILYTVVSHVLGGRSENSSGSHKDNGPRVSGALRASTHLQKS